MAQTQKFPPQADYMNYLNYYSDPDIVFSVTGTAIGVRGEANNARLIRDGNLWVVIFVKCWVNKQAGCWLAVHEWTTNQKLG